MIPAARLFGMDLSGTDRHGTVWTLRDEGGMWSSPEVRRTRVDRSQQDGSHPSTSVLAAHTFTLDGVMRALDTKGLLQSRADLARLATIREGVLVWADDLGVTYQDVELDSSGVRTRAHGDRVMEWQVTLTAPDPARYSADVELTAVLQVVAGVGNGWTWPVAWPIDWHAPDAVAGASPRVPVYNDGNTAWWPRLRIQTTAQNPRVTCPDTGDWVQINGSIPAGSWVDIDCRNRTVLLNGVQTWKWRTTWHGTWLAIPAGAYTSLVFSAAGVDPDGRLTIISKEGAWL